MKIEIHHYHHLGAEEKNLLQQLKQLLLPASAKLDGISEKLKFMANEEKQLNEGIAELRDITVDGFKAINESVDKAAQRVIQRLEEKGIDLSDEIGLLEAMKSAVRSSASETVQRLDEIAVPGKGSPEEPTEETPPVVSEEPQSGTETEELPSETPGKESTSESARETVEENNNPFDPSAENQKDGFDEQERTPVPHPNE